MESDSSLYVAIAAAFAGLLGGSGLAGLRKSGAERNKIVVDGALEVVDMQRDFVRDLTARVDHLVDEAGALRADLSALSRQLDETVAERDCYRREAESLRAELARIRQSSTTPGGTA